MWLYNLVSNSKIKSHSLQLAPSSISRHMKDLHNTSQLFKCNICMKKFQTNTKLEQHYANKHVANEIALHQCTSCEYTTMNKYYFKQHNKRQHVGNGSSSFVCNKCFVRKPNEYLLKKHTQQHIESICVICKKKFNARKDLKRHTKVHEVQRCEECGKWFGGKKELRAHRQVHKKHINADEEVDILSIDVVLI